MDAFRSITVQKYSCAVAYHSALNVIMDLLACSYIQFELTNQQDTKNPFFKILMRIQMLIHKLQILVEKIQNEFNRPMRRFTIEKKSIIIKIAKLKMQHKKIDCLKYLDIQQQKIQKRLYHLYNMNQNFQKLNSLLQNYIHQINVIKDKQLLIQQGWRPTFQFTLITGICIDQQKYNFQRLVFRASRGHCILIFKQISNENKIQRSSVFFCFISGGQNSMINTKIKKLCLSNKIQIFNLPNNREELEKYKEQIEIKIKQIKHLKQLSQNSLNNSLQYFAQNEEQPKIIKKLTKLKYLQRIFYILCHQHSSSVSSNHFMLSFYKPTNLPNPQNLILIPEKLYKHRTVMPSLPYLLQANTLTQIFAVPNPQQIIPSIFISITLPILFGMMFSDMGHALLLLAFTIGLNLNKIWYVMCFMSFFFGMLFNQFLGMKIHFLYKISGNAIGIDPIWGQASNALAFQNSLKMKLSIIIGFMHMFFGIMIKLVNEYHQKKYKVILLQTIPKIFLMVFTIGYLTFLIILKWNINFEGKTDIAPSIINLFMQMYLGEKQKKNFSLFSSVQKQKKIKLILHSINGICLCIIMFGKHIYNRISKSKEEKRQSYSIIQEQDDSQRNLGELSKENIQNHQQEFQHIGPLDAFQYILSLISSITSYLRLFALSLSHQKLSGLLLTYLLSGLKDLDPLVGMTKCLLFFIITILMQMLNILECLMHVVRLHWVQWMGKFYKGGGISFKPQIEGQH